VRTEFNFDAIAMTEFCVNVAEGGDMFAIKCQLITRSKPP
jgi:hypothetical protein